MKQVGILFAVLINVAGAAQAQMPDPQAAPEKESAPPGSSEAARPDPVMQRVAHLQDEWAWIKYRVADEDKRLDEMRRLELEATATTSEFPGRAEPMIWEAIILSTEAGMVKGLSALSQVKRAKALLEASLQLSPHALDGSALTSLGSLYYQVPGWPIGFGDDEKAEQYLKVALKVSPDGIDPNFFYGDYLVRNGRYADAVPFLEQGLRAPDRPGRSVADEGRRAEIRALLKQARRKAGFGPGDD